MYKETNFAPELPKETPDIIYLCFPNNPTGSTITKDQLQEWVDYANKVGAVIIYDAAYEAYISEDNVPHTIYECEGARTCAIELRSFSKNAGFTGVRLGATVIPKDIKQGDVMLHSLWARRHGTKYNGAPYIVQKAGEAVYSEAGKVQLKEQVAYYMNNAKVIYEGLKSAGYNVSGGVNAPYIWLQTPDKMTSWEFFDYLLENANVVGTPGSGFGPSGEGYFRLTACSYENTVSSDRKKQSIIIKKRVPQLESFFESANMKLCFCTFFSFLVSFRSIVYFLDSYNSSFRICQNVNVFVLVDWQIFYFDRFTDL